MPDNKEKTADTAPEEKAEELKEENPTEEAAEQTEEEAPKTEDSKEAAEEPEKEADAAQEKPEDSEKESGPAQKSAEETGKGRRFWQKQPGKASKADKKDAQIEELKDKVARQLAEFENFRKRTEKEKLQNYTIGARDVLEKILPVLDNFERGLEKADLSDPFAEGMDKVYKQLATSLEELGVTPIEAVGKEFDPNLHNAVMHVDDETLGENIVAEEYQKGYLYKDQVLRYSMVKVAN